MIDTKGACSLSKLGEVVKGRFSKKYKHTKENEFECTYCPSSWSRALKVEDDFKIDCHMSANFNVLRVCTTSLKRMYN